LLIVVYESFIFCISNPDDAAVARGEVALGLSLMHQLVVAEVAVVADATLINNDRSHPIIALERAAGVDCYFAAKIRINIDNSK
jgi:hypothetical protein